jgi:hypothetical protein
MFVYDLHAVLVPSAIGMDTGANQSIKSPKESQALVSKVLSFAQFVHDWRGAIGVLSRDADPNTTALTELTGGFDTLEPFHGPDVRPFG